MDRYKPGRNENNTDGITDKEKISSPEREIDPKSIALVTTTFYPKWSPEGDVSVDKVRGNLNILMLNEAKRKGYRVVVVDGGSSSGFVDRLKEEGIAPIPETEHSMSGSRRQAFNEGSALEGVKVIAWAEPEKVSIARDCLPEAVRPILDGRADIVIPKRGEESLRTYPAYQVEYEQKANKLFNGILRKHGLLPEDVEDLDVWFGPRFFKNDPELISLFTDKYEFDKRKLELDEIVDPDLWANAIFIPIIAALKNGYRVESVTVPYRHPPEQTALEKDDEKFRRKRDIQLKNIITVAMHFVRNLEQNPKSRLRKSQDDER